MKNLSSRNGVPLYWPHALTKHSPISAFKPLQSFHFIESIQLACADTPRAKMYSYREDIILMYMYINISMNTDMSMNMTSNHVLLSSLILSAIEPIRIISLLDRSNATPSTRKRFFFRCLQASDDDIQNSATNSIQKRKILILGESKS